MVKNIAGYKLKCSHLIIASDKIVLTFDNFIYPSLIFVSEAM
jgi:hypothetical protein